MCYTTYGGAPDECSRHWPEKREGCKYCLEEQQLKEARELRIADMIRTLTPWIRILRELEVYGLRRWRLTQRPRAGWTLRSLYSDLIWKPGKPVEAWCNFAKSASICTELGTDRYHQCGIWACPTWRSLSKQIRPKGLYIEGIAHLFGTVLDHNGMYRGQYGDVAAFYAEGMPGEVRSFLKRFDVPLLNRRPDAE